MTHTYWFPQSVCTSFPIRSMPINSNGWVTLQKKTKMRSPSFSDLIIDTYCLSLIHRVINKYYYSITFDNNKVYINCGKPGEISNQIQKRGWIPKVWLGKVIEGVFYQPQVLQLLGTWLWSHLHPIRYLEEASSYPASKQHCESVLNKGASRQHHSNFHLEEVSPVGWRIRKGGKFGEHGCNWGENKLTRHETLLQTAKQIYKQRNTFTSPETNLQISIIIQKGNVPTPRLNRKW